MLISDIARLTPHVTTHVIYKDLKNDEHVRCKLRYNEYVNSIVMDEDHKPKRLWSFIKSKRTDACGVAPLKRDGIAYSDARVKADILNH